MCLSYSTPPCDHQLAVAIKRFKCGLGQAWRHVPVTPGPWQGTQRGGSQVQTPLGQLREALCPSEKYKGLKTQLTAKVLG